MARMRTKDKKDRRIVDLYVERGMTLQETGDAVGMTHAAVAYRLERMGVARRNPPGGLSSGRFKWARENGMVSLTSLDVRSGYRNPKTVRAAIRRLDILPQKFGKNAVYITEAEAARVVSDLDSPYRLIPVPWREAGVTEAEMGWLAGIWDGEGTIGVTTRDYRGRTAWSVAIEFANTDRRIIDKAEALLQRLDVDFWEGEKPPEGNCRRAWYVRARGCVSVWRLCREMAPFLVAKRERAAMMMEFSERRAANGRRRGMAAIAEEYATRFAALSVDPAHPVSTRRSV